MKNYNIAIFTDPQEAEMLKMLIVLYNQKHPELEIKTRLYSTFEELCDDITPIFSEEYTEEELESRILEEEEVEKLIIKEAVVYDAVFLTVSPKYNGVVFAKKLYNLMYETTPFVFLAETQDYAAEAFAVRHSFYMIKPVVDYMFADTMDKIISKTAIYPKHIYAIDTNLHRLADLVDYLHEIFPKEMVVPFFEPLSALKAIYKNDTDMIFTELNLPHINGIELLGLIRKYNSKILVYLISDKEEYRKKAISEGAAGYLTRPIAAKTIREYALSTFVQGIS